MHFVSTRNRKNLNSPAYYYARAYPIMCLV